MGNTFILWQMGTVFYMEIITAQNDLDIKNQINILL